MDRKEQEILERIRERAEEIQVPETLYPEEMKKRLRKETSSMQKSKYRKRLYAAGSVAAACVVFAAGLLIWGDRQGQGRNSQTEVSWLEDTLADTGGMIRTAESYDEIYGYVEKSVERFRASVVEESASEGDMAVGDAGTASSGTEAGRSSAENYSQTNVRQEGVDEGDVVKTDGRYLYVLQDDGVTVAIVDTAGGQMETVGRIRLEDGEYIYEIYLMDGKMILVADSGADNTQETEVITYDIQKPAEPKEEGRVIQSGGYQSSRLSDGFVYLFTNHYIDLWNEPDPREPGTYLPSINDKVMEETDIYLPQTERADMYEVIVSIDPDQPDQVKDSKALMSKGGELYVSNENIYYYETIWQPSGSTVTAVRRVAYADGKLTGTAQGSFDGYLNDSFSIDEYNGYLRVVSTVDDTNSVYILNEKLEKTGSIEGLAEEERIYSARFMGDIAYFVTFRETDPLFSVDLSDPENPTILGALKIPGFSEYLHFYGEGKLLGIGMEVGEETQVTGGIKLTMFDITDPRNVIEKDTVVLEHIYYTDLFNNYKAVLIEPDQNMIGFSGYGEGGEIYFLFEYDEMNGFTCRMEEEINGSGSRSARGLYIGQVLYVVQGNVIESYSLEDYQKTGDLIL